MKSFEIYFNDLNSVAKAKFKKEGFYHENIELSPIAIIEIEDEDDNINIDDNE